VSKSKVNIIFIVISLLLFFLFWYNLLQIDIGEEFKTVLSLMTFLFAVFTGFFISRQGQRYSSMRDYIADFDGEMTTIYRQSRHLSPTMKNKIENIIKKEYKKIIILGHWDVPFVLKSKLIIDIHATLDGFRKKEKLNPIENVVLTRIFVATAGMQRARKRVISLGNENIPTLQWVVIILLATMLILLLNGLQTPTILFGTIVKAIFATVVLLTLLMLKKFDDLSFFEVSVGDTSARDVLGIMAGKK
jgi:hypothetical protein